MRSVADFLWIRFTSDLLALAFNGVPARANSSFPVKRAGLIDAPLTRREDLPADTVAAVEATLRSLHARALAAALQPAVPDRR